MAEGDLNKTISADGSQALREYVKLENANKKLREELKRLKDDSREGKNQFSAMASEQIKGLTGMVTGLFTVEKAVGFVTQAYGEWNHQMEEANRKAESLAIKTTKTLADAGLLLRGPEVTKILDSLGGVTREQGLAAFSGVHEGGPGLSLDRQGELARQTARFAPFDPTALHDVGTLIGRLGDIFPEKTADDIADMAAAMRGAAGKNIGQLTDAGTLRGLRGLVSSGALSESESIGFGVLAANKDISAKAVASIAAKLTENIDEVQAHRGVPLTAEQLAQNRFAGASPSERLNMLLSDKAVRDKIIGGAAGQQLGQISREDIAAIGAQIDAAQRNNLVGKQLESLALTESGRGAAGEFQEALEKDRSKRKKERIAMERQDYEEAFYTAVESDRAGLSGVEQAVAKTNYNAYKFIHWMTGQDDVAQTKNSALLAGAGANVFGDAEAFQAELLRVMHGVHQATEKTVEQLEEANGERRSQSAGTAAAVARQTHRE